MDNYDVWLKKVKGDSAVDQVRFVSPGEMFVHTIRNEVIPKGRAFPDRDAFRQAATELRNELAENQQAEASEAKSEFYDTKHKMQITIIDSEHHTFVGFRFLKKA